MNPLTDLELVPPAHLQPVDRPDLHEQLRHGGRRRRGQTVVVVHHTKEHFDIWNTVAICIIFPIQFQISFYETASGPNEFESRFPENVVAVVAVRVLGRVGFEDGGRAEVDATDLGAVREGILGAVRVHGIHRRR